MKTSLIDVVLIVFILSYVFSALIFMVKQKNGASFIVSFDKAIVRGGCFFVFGSGLSLVAIMYGNFTPGFI